MATIAEIRHQYPQYADMSDEQLAQGLHQKFYADMPFDQFAAKIGYQSASGSGNDPPVNEYDPTAGMSANEKRVAGASAQVRALGRGVRDLGINAALATRQPGADREKVDASLRQQEDAQRKLDAPLMSTPEGRQGAIGGAILSTLPAMMIPGGQTVAGGAAIGAGLGLAQPVGENDSRLQNGAFGGLLGGATPALMSGIGRIMRPVRNVLSGEAQNAVTGLKEAGVPLSVAQQTGSKAAQSVERALADNPVTAPAMATQLTKRVKAFTRASLRTVGENADEATPTVLNAAKTRIGGVMSEVESKYALKATPQALKEIADIEAQASRVLPDANNVVAKQIAHIKEIAAKNGGVIPGKSARLIRSELQKISSQPGAGEYAQSLREVIDDATQRAAQGTDDFARYQQARAQYRNLKSIEGAIADDGTISAAKLAQRLKSGKHTRNSYRYGTGDAELSNLARNMSSVLDRFPNSGTASRIGNQLILPGAGAVIGYAQNRDPMEAAKWAVAGWGGPKLAAAVMNNPTSANYLAQGMGRELPQNALVELLRRSGQMAGPALLASQSGN